MNKLANFVNETRKEVWKDENVKKLVDIFERQAELEFKKLFISKPFLATSCRAFGIEVKKLENEIFTFGEIIYDVDSYYKTDEETENGFIEAAEGDGYQSLDENRGTFNWQASIKGMQPFIEALEGRGYKVLNDQNAESLLIYFIVPK